MSDPNILWLFGIAAVVLIVLVFILRKKRRINASLEGFGVTARIGAEGEEPAPDVGDSAKRGSTSSRNVSIGGSADGATIVTGDRNQVS